MRGDGSSEDGSADPRAARRYGRLLSGPPRLRAATDGSQGRRKATRLAGASHYGSRDDANSN